MLLRLGPTDPLTALGWPVHNSFILAAVELGLLGALLFFLPVIWSILRAIKLSVGRSPGKGESRLLLSTAPGLLIIGLTGWGLLADSILRCGSLPTHS